MVAVAKVDREDLYNDVPFPRIRPYQEVELHAKVSGYVSEMKVDFGDHVKAGQLLATLEVPELTDELHNAMAAVRKRKPITRMPISSLPDSSGSTSSSPIWWPSRISTQPKQRIARQRQPSIRQGRRGEIPDHAGLYANHRSIRWRDHVARRDPGALIQAGTMSDTQAKSLLKISDNYRLRLDFPVSVEYVKDIHLGDKVNVRVESLGGKTFTGSISRFTQMVNDATRTMITEIEVPNPNLEIVPGMYATAVLKVEKRLQSLAIPIQASASGGSPRFSSSTAAMKSRSEP